MTSNFSMAQKKKDTKLKNTVNKQNSGIGAHVHVFCTAKHRQEGMMVQYRKKDNSGAFSIPVPPMEIITEGKQASAVCEDKLASWNAFLSRR